MNMKNRWLILTTIVLLMSCGNKAKSDLPLSDVEEGWGERYQKELEDSLAREKVLNDEPAKNAVVNPTSVSNSSGSSKVHSSSDNMRGFDPASEDDMDDNGMSRYMENNDEEGWD
jgi:hypothetical protein